MWSMSAHISTCQFLSVCMFLLHFIMAKNRPTPLARMCTTMWMMCAHTRVCDIGALVRCMPQDKRTPPDINILYTVYIIQYIT